MGSLFDMMGTLFLAAAAAKGFIYIDIPGALLLVALATLCALLSHRVRAHQ